MKFKICIIGKLFTKFTISLKQKRKFLDSKIEDWYFEAENQIYT